MTVYEMAKGYYPRLWPVERLDELVKAGRLTQAERDEIVNAVEVPNEQANQNDSP